MGSRDLLTRRLEWLDKADNATFLRGGLRGVEKETLRVTAEGALSQRPHPEELGSKLTHPSITTDYSEALLELVTPPVTSNWAMVQDLCDIHVFVHERLDGELLWPLSMPCAFVDDAAIPIADYGSSNLGMLRSVYRRGLGHRYGRSMQAIAGVHFNYSPPSAFWPVFQSYERNRDDARAFKSSLLMALARNYRRHAWLVAYLFGASPTFAKSFLPSGSPLVEQFDADSWYAPYATSLRMSDLGYQNKNQARPEISLNSLEAYVKGLTRAVTTREPRYEQIGVVVDGEYRQLSANVLQIENEYYSTIRPKPPKSSLRTTIGLREHGVEYVEIRTLDLNPADPIGVNQRQLRFLEALALFCMLTDSPPISAGEQREIDARSLTVAREGRRPGLEVPVRGETATLSQLAAKLTPGLTAVAAVLDDGGDEYRISVAEHLAALDDAHVTPSARLLTAMRDAGLGFQAYGLEIARRHHAYFVNLGLDAAKAAVMREQVRESWRATRELELDKSLSFSEFLSRFLSRV